MSSPPSPQSEAHLASDLSIAVEHGDREALIQFAIDSGVVLERSVLEAWADMMMEIND